jgi:hypothetical protein
MHGSAPGATRPDPRPRRHGGPPPPPPPRRPPPPRSVFDWYQATIEAVDDHRVAPGLAIALSAELRQAKPRHGYGRAHAVCRGEDVLATVYGGSARDGEVHVAMTGAGAQVGVPVLRSLYPSHRASRADSAIDFSADFDRLEAAAVEFAERRGLKHSILRDSDGGATRRIGSPASEVFVRLYKKSEQLRALHPDRAAAIPDGIVRAELVARPSKRDTKERLGRMESDELWGLGQWSAEYAQEVLGFEPARVPTHFRRPSDWSRAVHFLGRQYRPMVERRIADVGLASARAEVLEALGLS